MSLDWQAIARTHVHPLKLRILAHLDADQGRQSPTQIATALGEPLGNVSYHVRVLVDEGLLKASGTLPRRGAVEHFYRLSKKARDDAS